MVTLESRSTGTTSCIRIATRPITSKQRIRGKINHALSAIRLRSGQDQSVIRILIRIVAVTRAIVPRPRKHRAHEHPAARCLQQLNLAPEVRHHRRRRLRRCQEIVRPGKHDRDARSLICRTERRRPIWLRRHHRLQPDAVDAPIRKLITRLIRQVQQRRIRRRCSEPSRD